MVDGAGDVVLEQADTLAADRFADGRSAEHRWRVPFDKLAPGMYLLTFEATAGRVTATRDLVFQIKN
jgi:hypothetical protein